MSGESQQNEENVPHFFLSMLTAMGMHIWSKFRLHNTAVSCVRIHDFFANSVDFLIFSSRRWFDVTTTVNTAVSCVRIHVFFRFSRYIFYHFFSLLLVIFSMLVFFYYGGLFLLNQ